MKSIIYSVLVFLCALSYVTAQIETQWEAYIYVEDAKGNKDSISLASVLGLGPGYHHPELGEAEWPLVLDSVLDIRTVIQESPRAGLLDEYKLSKRRVLGIIEREFRDTICNIPRGAVNIGIYAKYQPIKLYWKASEWNNKCQLGNFITADAAFVRYLAYNFVNDSLLYGCLSQVDHMFWSFPLSDQLNESEVRTLHFLKDLPTTDNQMGTMWLATLFFNTCSPCNCIVNTNDIYLNNMQLYPNPAKDIITIKAEIPVRSIKIYSLDGTVELVEQNTLGQEEIDISSISPGMKIIEIRFQNNQKSYKKWVKL